MRFTLFLPLAFLLVLASCKSQKKLQSGEVMHDGPKGLTVEALRDSFAQRPIEFEKLSFKGDGQTDGTKNGMDMGFNYKLRLRHDSLIWCSVTKFSIEFMQGIVGKDSVKMRTSMPEGALVCDLGFLSDKLGFSPSLLMAEQLLTGQPWLEGDSIEVLPNFANPWRVVSHKNGYKIVSYIAQGPLRLTQIEISHPQKKERTQLTYADYRLTEAGLLPHLLTVSLDREGSLSTVTLTHNTVTVNGEKTTFDFHIPDGTKISTCGQP